MSGPQVVLLHEGNDALAADLETAMERARRVRGQRLVVTRYDSSQPTTQGSTVSQRLASADWMVLLASPESAQSDLVGDHIQAWADIHGTAQLLILLTSGTWQWDTTRNDVDLSASSAAHPALVGIFSSEPRHMDLSWAKAPHQRTLRHTKFHESIVEIVAQMHGMSKDELFGDDVILQRRTQRRMRLSIAALVGLTLLALGGAAIANSAAATASEQRVRADVERGRAVEQTQIAQEARDRADKERRLSDSRRLASLSRGTQSADGALSRLLALASHDLAQTAEAEAALGEAALITDGWSGGNAEAQARLIGHEQRPLDLAATADGSVLASLDELATLRIWSGGDASTPVTVPGAGGGALAFSGDNQRIASAATLSVGLFDLEGAETDRVAVAAGVVAALGPSAFVTGGTDGVAIIDEGGSIVAEQPLGSPVTFIGASLDGETIVAGTESGQVLSFDTQLREQSAWTFAPEDRFGRPAPRTVLALSPEADSVVLPPDGRDVLGPNAPESDMRDAAIAGVYAVSDGAVIDIVASPDAYLPYAATDAEYLTDGTVIAVSPGGVESPPSLGGTKQTDQLSSLPLPLQADLLTVAPEPGLLLVAGQNNAATIIEFPPSDGTTDPDPSTPTTSAADAATVVCRLAGRNFSEAEWETYLPDQDYKVLCANFEAPHEPSLAADTYPNEQDDTNDPTAPTPEDQPGEATPDVADIDFANETYPVTCIVGQPNTLVDGQAQGLDYPVLLELIDVTWLPMNNDDVEDAVVTLNCTEAASLATYVLVVDGTSTEETTFLGEPIFVLNGSVAAKPGQIETDEPAGNGKQTWEWDGEKWTPTPA